MYVINLILMTLSLKLVFTDCGSYVCYVHNLKITGERGLSLVRKRQQFSVKMFSYVLILDHIYIDMLCALPDNHRQKAFPLCTSISDFSVKMFSSVLLLMYI